MKKKKELEEFFKRKYPNKKIMWKLYNSRSQKQAKDFSMDAFISKDHTPDDDTIEIVFSVKLFDEGFHVDNVDIGLMYSKTNSDIEYRQRIGRFFGEMEKRASIIDFSGGDGLSHPVDWERINKYAKEKENHPIYHTPIEDISYIPKVINESKKLLGAYYEDSKGRVFLTQDITSIIPAPEGCTPRQWSEYVKFYIGRGPDFFTETKKKLKNGDYALLDKIRLGVYKDGM